MKKSFRIAAVVFVLIMAVSILIGCGQRKYKKIELELSANSFTSIENAAPASDYVFYINEDDQTNLASGNLKQFGLVVCTGDNALNLAVQIGKALGISNVGNGKADQSSVDDALNKRNNIVVTKKDIVPSVKTTEVGFKKKQ